MAMVDMREAKSSLSELVAAVESGAEREIVITRNGTPAARLVGIESGSGGKRLGVARGKFNVRKSIDARNDEVARVFSST